MAKTRTKQKSKKKNKDDKLSTGRQNKKAKTLDKMDKPKFRSSDEKKKYLIENSHLIQDKVFNELAKREGKLDKEALAKKPNKLIAKGGKLGRRCKHTKFMDSVLMSELLITQTPTKHKSKLSSGHSKNNGEDASTDENEAKNRSNQKWSKIMAQRLDKLKKVKLSNGVSVSVTNYECDNCNFTFCSKSSLQTHMLIHLNLKPYSCAHCPAAFRQRGNWRVHMARAHPVDFKSIKYQCKICKKPFQLKEHLKLHQKAHAKEKERKRYQCAFCETDFKTESLLTHHEKQHMAPGRYRCNFRLCSMTFDSRAVYFAHLKSHAQAQMQDYRCQFCGKTYLKPGSIARHIRVSHGGVRMQCPVCNKLLRGHLSEHIRTHENERPHECDVCGQRFTQSTQLTVHKRCHSGAKPYLCKICKKPFAHSNALMLHIRRHTGEKPFECAMCPQTFSQLPHMKAHMRSIHRKTEFYKCNHCNSFFKLKSLLEAHAEECVEAVAELKQEKAPEGTKDETLVSRLRFLLALLFTMITSKRKLDDLGFNKRLIDDILVDSIEAMGLKPSKDPALPPLSRLRGNALMLLQGTVPKYQMDLFVKQNKSTEELLELLTDYHNKKNRTGCLTLLPQHNKHSASRQEWRVRWC